MSLKLTAEMSAAIRQRDGLHLMLEDGETHLQYVLVPLEVYQRVTSVLADESLSVVETYAAQSAVAGAAGWDDPEMDVYDNYDAYRPTS